MFYSHHGAGDGAELDHGGYIGLDVGTLHRVVILDVNDILEIIRVESPGDETLVDAARGAEETERDDGKPQTPIEDTSGLVEVLETEDVDGFLDAACHDAGRFLSRFLLVCSVDLLVQRQEVV